MYLLRYVYAGQAAGRTGPPGGCPCGYPLPGGHGVSPYHIDKIRNIITITQFIVAR